ncbi:MAG: hypothetical protein V4690_01810 [Patescibacteria group bacterium]
MKKAVIVLGIVLVLLSAFYVVNAFIYEGKQSKTVMYPDGEYFGYIRTFTDNGTAIDFDDAVWLTEETGAADAAIAAGDCTEREYCTPNGFYIYNKTIVTTRLPVSPNVEVKMLTWKMEETGQVTETPIPTIEFVELINNRSLYWKDIPYTVTIANGEITKILERYVP